MQSTAQNQTGAQYAASVSAERQMPERGRQDHAGQHGSIVEGPSFEERSNSPLITDVSRTPTTSFKIENPNLAEHPVDDSGGETRRRDGPVIGESASVESAPRKTLRAEVGAENFQPDELALGFHWPPWYSVPWLHLHAIYPRSEMVRRYKYTFLSF